MATGERSELLLETLFSQMIEAGLLDKRRQQRTDSVAVLASVKVEKTVSAVQQDHPPCTGGYSTQAS